MAVKRNALDHALEFPKAADVVENAFYVDDCLTGANSIEEATDLHHQLLHLFAKGGFLLRKWSSSDPTVLHQISPELRDTQSTHHIPDPDEYTKTLGIEWNACLDHFRLTVAILQETGNITRRALVSDIAKTFVILGWFSPTIINVLWETRIGWDDLPSPAIYQSWLRWRSELPLYSRRDTYHVVTIPKMLPSTQCSFVGFVMPPKMRTGRCVHPCTRQKWKHTHFVGCLENKGFPHQASDNTTPRTVWRSTTGKAPSPHQEGIKHPNSECLRVD